MRPLIAVLRPLFLGLCLWCGSLFAAQELDLYRAEVLVASQSDAERVAAARTALGELLIRVSGDTGAPGYPGLAAALRRAPDYLHEFRYANTDQRLERDGDSVPASLLILRFAPQAIGQLLREAGVPFWPASRPRVLVWNVTRDAAGGYQRVPEEAVMTALERRAGLRGLPLLLPNQDFEDRIALTDDGLWNLDVQELRQASERYQADAMLAGRYTREGEGPWKAEWVLSHSSGEQRFRDQADTPDLLFTRALDSVADYFARLYALVPGGEGGDTLVMRVTGVNDFAAHKQLQRYLEGLAMVKHLELLQVEGNTQLLRLTLEGDQTLLRTTLELGRRLIFLADSGPQYPDRGFDNVLEQGLPPPVALGQETGGTGSTLSYRWQP